MVSNWRSVTVEDLASHSKNALVGGPFGSNLVSRDYEPVGVPVIRGDNMSGRWVSGDFVFVSDKKAASLSANMARPGDIVFTQRGTLGQVSLVPPEPYERYIISQSQMKLSVNQNICDPLFVYYQFTTDTQFDYVQRNAIQTGVPHTNLGILRRTPVELPPLAEQRAIASILSSLDDKIELNRRVSKTLEAMARALFKSWFVDFDPVRAKADGRDPGLPASLLELFPNEMEADAEAEIPSGWRVGTVSDLCQINPSRLLKKGTPAPYFDMASLPTSGHVPDAPVERPYGSGMRFRNGDTLLARITPCLENGKTAYVDVLGENEIAWGSTEYIVLSGQPGVPAEFPYCLARSDEFRTFAIQSMTGTSGRQRVPAEAVASYPLPIPPAAILAAFGQAVRPLFERIRGAAQESRNLAALRDTLLPKLISGEIRVKVAEHTVEAAVG